MIDAELVKITELYIKRKDGVDRKIVKIGDEDVEIVFPFDPYPEEAARKKL